MSMFVCIYIDVVMAHDFPFFVHFNDSVEAYSVLSPEGVRQLVSKALLVGINLSRCHF